jgi:putative ABC transport system ATP-binding protein
MGRSGSGKSTLLFLLAGLEKASDGRIWLDSLPIHQRSEKELALLRRKHIGFVFQDHNLIPDLTLLENVLLPGYLMEKGRSGVRQRALTLLAALGIADLADRLPSQVSSGEQQRCAIARALINQPRVLLADEPTGNLNSTASRKVLDCLSQVHQQGQTILMVTHDPRSACQGDRVLFLEDGRIVDELPLGTCKESPGEKEARLIKWLATRGW